MQIIDNDIGVSPNPLIHNFENRNYKPINYSYKKIYPGLPQEISHENFGSLERVVGGLGHRTLGEGEKIEFPALHKITKLGQGQYSPQQHSSQLKYENYQAYNDKQPVPRKELNKYIGLET